jgi:hypothetical protein
MMEEAHMLADQLPDTHQRVTGGAETPHTNPCFFHVQIRTPGGPIVF